MAAPGFFALSNPHRANYPRFPDIGPPSKGSVEALHESWRLKTVIYSHVQLATTMSKCVNGLHSGSSHCHDCHGLEPSNNFEPTSRPLLPFVKHKTPNFQRVRWFRVIPFIHDMRNFIDLCTPEDCLRSQMLQWGLCFITFSSLLGLHPVMSN